MGLFAGAVFFVLMGLVMFSIGLAYLIHWNGEGLDLQWAFLIVFVVYLLVAALLGFLGYRKVQKVRGPEKAIAQAQKTKAALTTGGGLTGPCAATSARAVLRVDGLRGRRCPASPPAATCVGRQRVAGVGVGQRRGEHHARPRRRPRTRPARRSCPGRTMPRSESTSRITAPSP